MNWIQKICNRTEFNSQGLDDGGANISGPLFNGQTLLFQITEEDCSLGEKDVHKKNLCTKSKSNKSRHKDKKMH